MTTWISVPVGERRRWLQGISLEASIDCFQLSSTHGTLEGPWSYALFVHEPAQPDILTAYFATTDADALEAGFNPFKEGYGTSLTQEEARALIALLKMQMNHLAENQAIGNPAFQLLEEENYAKFHLGLESSKYVQQYFYRQIQPHAGMKNGDDISTILLFSKNLPYLEEGPYSDVMISLAKRTHQYERLFFKAMQFQTDELENANFQPEDYALPRISLDRNDIQHLIELFQKFLT